MQVSEVKTKAQIKEYLQFIKSLYSGDDGYVCTQKFNAQSLLYRQTEFAKSCFIRPVIAYDGKRACAVCTFIHNPKLPYLQIGLFEAEKSAKKAVELFVNMAKEVAAELNLTKIIVGLNGHLSYGVGILEENFSGKISFDSIYNKPYYKDFFEPYISKKETLCTYRTEIEKANKIIDKYNLNTSLTVREADFKRFADETEVLRTLCDKTLIKTTFYTPTDKNHFNELMGGLKVFLRNENLLFALSGGKECGFLFWHPDYNSMLCSGKDYNLLQIYLRAKKTHEKTDTLKINAIGSDNDNAFTTASLIAYMAKRVPKNYKYAETTFVWDNNYRSKAITQKIFGEPYRKYGVYLIDV